MTRSDDKHSLQAPHPDRAQHIQFEGCDSVVLAPEDYEQLWNGYERAKQALDRAAYALFQVKRMVNTPVAVIDFVREKHGEACAVFDALPSAPSHARPRGAYEPLTEAEIEEWRKKIKDKIFSDFCGEPNEAHGKKLQADFDRLCNMASNCILYAEEIHRLREAQPSSELPNTAGAVAEGHQPAAGGSPASPSSTVTPTFICNRHKPEPCSVQCDSCKTWEKGLRSWGSADGRPFGAALATAILQSNEYHHLDELARAECDELLERWKAWIKS